MTDILTTASIFALLFRVASIVLFILVALQQFAQFKRPSIWDGENGLKKLLFHFTVAIIVSQIPITLLHVDRILTGGAGSKGITAVATVTNAISLLIVSILLYLIYRKR